MRAAVVGHVEWVEFVRVARMPTSGEIVHSQEWWEEPAGGGPGAAVQLRKLTGECILFTALGADDFGRRARDELAGHGLRVEAASRREATRRAITHVEGDGERTITVIGERLGPRGEDDLAWHELETVDAVYFTAGDLGALRYARNGRILVATSRVLPLLVEARVELDALVGSELDPAEDFRPRDLDRAPRLVVRTRGADGGTFAVRGEPQQHYEAVAVPGPIVDRYGAGDSFAGGLAYALAAGLDPRDACRVAARCAAATLTGRGPYAGQLDRAGIEM